MFSQDVKTQEILKELRDFEHQKNERNTTVKAEFEAEFHKDFAVWPTKTSSGKWIWFESYYVRFEAIKKSFARVSSDGSIEITDFAKHYIAHEFREGKALEVLTEKEYFVKHLEGK